MKKSITLFSAALGLTLCLGALPARAANYVVTNLNDSGTGSLRAAVENAADTTADDTITFDVSGTIVLKSVLNYSPGSRGAGSLLIDGTGQSITISGNNAVPVLADSRSSSSVIVTTLTLKALTIANGKANSRSVVDRQSGNLEIVDCLFLGNSTTSDASVVYAYWNLKVLNSEFSGNSISGGGSVIRAPVNNGSLTAIITNSRFVGNSKTAGSDGTVLNTRVPTTITNSSFESNTGTSAAVYSGNQFASLTVTGSTFTGNTASSTVGSTGGAITAGGPVAVANSTFHGNSSAGAGGAILVFETTAPTNVTNSTFSDNRSGAGGALAVTAGSTGSVGTVTLRNSIVANSTGGNCGAGVADGGGNLSDDMSCGFKLASSLNGTAAQLGPLADNGGPTKTMMPLTGSPAIDQGVNGLALNAAGAALSTDQRGSARIIPTGGTVDRGAVEAPFQVALPPTLNTCPVATAQVGVAYRSVLDATGGTAPNRFAFTGSLPLGLALGAGSRALAGTPIKPGSYAFTATVTDSASPTPRSSSKACTITVAEAANRGPLIVTPMRLHYAPVPLPAVLMKQTVTLTNIGNPGSPPVKGGGTPVQLGPVSVTPDPGTAPDAFTLLNPCPAVLYVGQSCIIVVVGPARPATPLSATLNIPNNAPASPQTVALSAAAAP